eukprot:1172250-Prorocentrum_minimum.AAC.1
MFRPQGRDGGPAAPLEGGAARLSRLQRGATEARRNCKRRRDDDNGDAAQLTMPPPSSYDSSLATRKMFSTSTFL